MPRTPVRTRPVTLHRLPRLNADSMIDAVGGELADDMDLQVIDIAGMPAVWVAGSLSQDEGPEWCADASVTTGLDIAHDERRSGGLLLLCVDGRLLGPTDEPVHVKQAKGSAPLSHLFNPALVSTQTLAFAPGTGPEFARVVAKFGGGRVIASDFEPKKVVLAILLKRGAPLDVDTLFPFSQVTLAHTATVLHQRHRAELEVIGIPQAA